jgi:hypothetical protein
LIRSRQGLTQLPAKPDEFGDDVASLENLLLTPLLHVTGEAHQSLPVNWNDHAWAVGLCALGRKPANAATEKRQGGYWKCYGCVTLEKLARVPFWSTRPLRQSPYSSQQHVGGGPKNALI